MGSCLRIEFNFSWSWSHKMNGSDKESDYDFSQECWSKPSDESSQGSNMKSSCNFLTWDSPRSSLDYVAMMRVRGLVQLVHGLVVVRARSIRQRYGAPHWSVSIVCLAVNENVHFKILVPSIAAGAIIGKGGEAIGQIQKETGAKVKMSKANDFYPGWDTGDSLINRWIMVWSIDRFYGGGFERVCVYLWWWTLAGWVCVYAIARCSLASFHGVEGGRAFVSDWGRFGMHYRWFSPFSVDSFFGHYFRNSLDIILVILWILFW